jgi:hypothetical protein
MRAFGVGLITGFQKLGGELGNPIIDPAIRKVKNKDRRSLRGGALTRAV